MKNAGLLFWLLCGLAPLRGETLYVAADGRAGALPSLAAARDSIRARRSSGAREPVTVVIRQGTYFLSEPLVLEPRDSDTTWSASPGDRVIVSGGRRIENWRKGAGGWSAPAAWNFRQLFVGGRRGQRARSPNHGFFRIDGVSSQDKPFRLRFRGNEIAKSWAGRGVEVIVLLAWAELRMPILAVDEAARVATLAGDPRPSNRETDARYFIENAPEALDAPGEWYLDREAGQVSYRPRSGEDMATEEVIAPVLTQLVRLEGRPEDGQFVRRVRFQGLEFRHTDWTLGPQGYADTQAAVDAPAAIDAVGAEDCAIEKCVFRAHGGYAVWFGRGSKRNRIAATEITDMGGGGVKIGETVQRANPAEQNSGHVVTDNHIHDLGKVYPAAVGVWIGQSSRNTIAHNHIHDLYYTAISAGWTWGYGPNQCQGNTIEWNHLHHVGKDMLSDMGAIYTLGVQPGTAVRYNLIHDVSAFTYGGWGIYPDEGSSEMLIENNIVYRCKSAAFHQHYGRDNLVRNNIFAFNREFQLMRSRAEPHRSFVLERNIVYFDEGALLGGNWTGDQFRLDRNLYFDTRGPVRFPGTNSVEADPGFVNAGEFNFALRPDSPALKMGFHPIDLRGAGPRP
ncbi:MAG: right-handed parallel beta-helix repeat-containing protein [Candidatus Solibacter usitatus]|nr:right-handed parallel beta-helix repeat-containing protein [Candidatus Solibacter usitatus]